MDKNNQPRWRPAALEGVSDGSIDNIFEPMLKGEEWTPFAPNATAQGGTTP